MRPLLALATCSLTALALAGPNARAETASGWVDPPAKTTPAKPNATAPAGDAAKAASRSPEKSAEPDQPGVAESRAAGSRHRHQAERHQDRRGMAASSEIDTTAPDPRFGSASQRAQRLTGEYLDSVSAPNGAMLAEASRFYGDRVRFHGRSMTIAALIAEKRRFAQRWPERHYASRDGSLRTACDAAGRTCVIRAVVGFSAASPTRAARSQGLSELTLTIDVAGARPVIVSETSRVLRRGNAALSASERGRSDGA